MVRTKRVYEAYDPADGYRVLVDRLWPRVMRKEAAHLDAWLKDVAPSEELRKSFSHVDERWSDFVTRYRRELRDGDARAIVDDLAARARRGTVTLLYATKDETHNNAVVLRDVIEKLCKGPKTKVAPTRTPRARTRSRPHA